ncbi:MAG: PDZ domain-containing protein [Propionibacteriaceae bacterium]|jgi:PDZ domain-containing protein|nr:PDZ domain-containing protein [Propionibacteriaceae bacterium]
MQRTRTIIVASVMAVMLAVTAALLPTPYVIWSPGEALAFNGDSPLAITIKGAATYPTSTDIRYTEVTSSAAQARLVKVLLAHQSANEEALPAEWVQASPEPQMINPGKEADTSATATTTNAMVAALREARIQVQPMPMVVTISAGGPSAGVLEVGDLVAMVDGQSVSSPEEVRTAISEGFASEKRKVGDAVVIDYIRNNVALSATITTKEASASNNAPGTPGIGVTFTQGYQHQPQLEFADVDDGDGEDDEVTLLGTSEGLMLALAIYDQLTVDSLAGERMIAGAGVIDINGQVTAVDGIKQRIAAAQQAGASLMIVPRENCEAIGQSAGIPLLAVENLHEAVTGLSADLSELKGC